MIIYRDAPMIRIAPNDREQWWIDINPYHWAIGLAVMPYGLASMQVGPVTMNITWQTDR